MNEKHIDDSLLKVRAIFEKASARIEALKMGERIPATKLAEELAPDFNTTGPALYHTLKYLFNGYPGFSIKRGAHGGIERLPLTVEVVIPASENKS